MNSGRRAEVIESTKHLGSATRCQHPESQGMRESLSGETGSQGDRTIGDRTWRRKLINIPTGSLGRKKTPNTLVFVLSFRALVGWRLLPRPPSKVFASLSRKLCLTWWKMASKCPNPFQPSISAANSWCVSRPRYTVNWRWRRPRPMLALIDLQARS